MLTPEQAQQRLLAHSVDKFDQLWLQNIPSLSDDSLTERLASLPISCFENSVPITNSLRQIAYGLICYDREGKRIERTTQAKIDRGHLVYQSSIHALVLLQSEERQLIFQIFFPKIYAHIEQLWQFLPTRTYQLGYARKAFRAPGHEEIYLSTRSTFIHQMLHNLGRYHEDIAWFAEHAAYVNHGHNAHMLGQLFAAVIDGGGEAGDTVFDILLASARGEHEVGAMGRHVTRALLGSSRVEGWEFVEKLLLAAQREEGLRQTILEAVDEAHPEAFRRILRVIIQHELSRFSAVTRAMNVWFGFAWDSESIRVVNRTLEQTLSLLENEALRAETLQTGNGESVYLALWTIAFDDVFKGIDAATSLLTDENVERRFAAVLLLSNLGLSESKRALIPTLRDPDLRVAVSACYALGHDLKGSGIFEEAEALLARLPKAKEKSLGTLIWEWRAIVIRRDYVAGMLIAMLEDRSPKRLIPYMDEFNSYQRHQAAQKLIEIGLDDLEVRDLMIKLIGDRDGYVRQQILPLLEKQTIQPEESIYLEGLLVRKTDDLRRGVLSLLTSQPAESALASADRLTDSRKIEQRIAGLELLHLLKQKEKAVEDCQTRAIHYQDTHAELSAVEQNLIRSITITEENLTLDNALGLMNPDGRTPPTPPQKREVRSTSKAALASLYSLDALIYDQRATPMLIPTWQGEKQEVLLGNANYQFPQTTLKDPIADDIARLPLKELWEQWVETRSSDLLDDDGLELLRALIQMDLFAYEQNMRWMQELEVEDKTQIKLRYRQQIRTLLTWLIRLYPAPNTADFLLDHLENVSAELPEETMRKNDSRYGYTDWRSNNSSVTIALNLVRSYRNTKGSDWQDHHHVRLWGLLRWMDEPLTDVPRCRPTLQEALNAFRLGAATEDDLYDMLIGARTKEQYGYARGSFDDFRNLSSKKPNPLLEKYPTLKTIFERCRERVLEVELRRGEMPNAATDAAGYLRSVPGTDWFLRILQALGTQDIERERYGGNSRTASFSHLLKVTIPTEQDTVEQFVKAVKAVHIPERQLVEAAVYAPLWSEYVEKALGWKGFSEAVWWLHAHTKDSHWSMDHDIREEWTAAVSERTPLSARDLLEGAVDVDWFWRIYKALGEKRWEMMYDAAKYSSGGIGHNRAKQFADAMLGKLEREALLKRVQVKHHQDSVRALGLLPIPKKGRDKAILERYQMMQEFIRGSRKFGPQRRESEKLAVQIGMENLARTAGYPDPARLAWAMEAREVSDLRGGAIHATTQDVTMSLRINELGKPQLSIERGGKSLKALPTKLKKTPEFVALRDRKSQIDKQYSRMRESLETGMCRADSFTSAELKVLLEHPVLAPMLEQLIFVGDGVMGYPIEQGRALLRYDGSTVSLTPETPLRIAHAYDLYQSSEWHLWQRDCFLAERIQPFKQVFRELYLLTEAERQEGAISRRYAGHQVQPRQAIALLGSRGWIAHPDYGVQKTFHRQDLSAHITFLGGYFTPADAEGLTLEGVMFSKAGNWKPLQLEELPPILFSEVMRDLDLVVSVAHRGGVDPETTASTVEMRTALLRETCALLKVTNVTLQSRHALIEGKLGSYSVHLGSALVHRQPGGALCIIPVHAQHRGRIFLPFADDDPKTAEVISKVILLAKDSDIKDPSILEQIFAKG